MSIIDKASRLAYDGLVARSGNMSVLSAARTLGSLSGWTLTQLTMQKMLYVAQMLHLGRTSTPLFAEPIEAWKMGPVVRELRRAIAQYGSNPIPDVFAGVPLFDDGAPYAALVDAFSMTRDMPVGQLVDFTHRPGGAWAAYYKAGHMGVVIPVEAIHEEWKSAMQPSNAALAWANQMADELAVSTPRYLDAENERAFRARVCGPHFS